MGGKTARGGSSSGSSKGNGGDDDAKYSVEHMSGFEPWFVRTCCDPLLPFIPRWVTPNAITVTSLFCIVGFFILAVIIPALEDTRLQLLLRLGIVVLMVVYAVLDCLDGAHARKSGQSSKIGEALDHWVDALGTPLTAAALAISIQHDAASMVISLVGCTFLYNAQLILLKYTGTLVHHTSGALAQMVTATSMLACAIILNQFPRSAHITVFALLCVTIGSIISLIQIVGFFYYSLGRRLVDHIPIAASCTALTVIFMSQVNRMADIWSGMVPYTLAPTDATHWMTPLAFTLTIAAVSLRISGTLVILTSGRPKQCTWNCVDWLSITWTASLVALALAQGLGGVEVPYKVAAAAPYLMAAHCALKSAYDLFAFTEKIKAS